MSRKDADIAVAVGGLWSLRAHEVVEGVAVASPANLALVCGPDRLTYRELDRRANAVAHTLIAAGVGRGDPVVLAMPRCLGLFVTLLGVLKAGGCYVPVDPRHPSERVRSVVDQARPRVAVTDGSIVAGLEGVTVLSLDEMSGERDDHPGVEGDASDLAYILFTSGSTGAPKGVPIRHDGISRLVRGQDYMPFGPETSWLKLAPMGFDVSTLEIFGAWMHGAALVVWDRDEVDAAGLELLCAREQPRACCMAFGLFAALLESNPGVFAPMWCVATGGEAVLTATMARARQLLPSVRFVNGYGPTETTMLATAGDMNPADDCLPTVPIGRPLQGVAVRVLDSGRQPVLPGEVGELAIGGVGVTPGYLGRDDLNAERFIEDPLGEHGRMFLSGDAVRELPDGRLLFVTRMDDQVKVRGQRVELGEIESVLERQAGVRRAAVAIVGARGNETIVACVTAEVGLDAEAVRAGAESMLPRVMVPARVLVCETLPVTGNGKVDRKAVGRLHQQFEERGRIPDDALVTETERAVADVWSAVLGLEACGRSRSFLELGGHSLRAMVACSRLGSKFGVVLTVPELFRLGSLERVAGWIDQQQAGLSGSQADRQIAIAATNPERPATPAEQRMWLLDQLHPGDPAYIIAVRLRHEGVIDRRAFGQAWGALLRRHGSLLSGFHGDESGPVRRPCDHFASAPEWHDARGWSADEVSAFEKQFARTPFDLTAPPLGRCAVLDLGERGSIVLVALHHIASDGWSCVVLRRDLDVLYAAMVAGSTPELPPVPVDAAALWQQVGHEADSAWWVNRLAGAARIELPTDMRGSDGCGVGLRRSVVLDGNETGMVRSIARRLGVTPFAVLLGCFHAWLYRTTRVDDLVVGTPVACRETPGLEDAVGFFMETLAVRTSVRQGATGEDMIRAAATTFAEASERRGVPFQDLVQRLGVSHEAGRNPLFEVFFNHIALALRDNSGLFRFDGGEIDNGTAKFDLTCYAIEEDHQVELVFNARSSLFSGDTVDRWVQQYARLLRGICQDPSLSVGVVPMLSNDERDAFESNNTRPAIQVDGPLLADQRVLGLCLEQPDSTAVLCEAGGWLYRDLAGASAAVAGALSRAGIGRGRWVLCAAQDQRWMAAAVLGTLRSGAAYVPIDLAWPDERLRAVHGLVGPSMIVCDSGSAARLEAIFGSTGLLRADIAPACEAPAVDARAPDDAAYMLFTSGTTGVPKGVVQTHGGLVRQIETYAASIEVGQRDVLIMLSTHAFDSAIMDMYGAWFRGAAWLPFAVGARGAHDLARTIRESGVSVFHAAPTVLRWLASDLEGDGEMTSVRAVVLGGEPSNVGDLEACRRLFPRFTRFVNGMGMSESSLTVQWHAGPAADPGGAWCPIGRSTPGVVARLLGPDGSETDAFGEIEIETDRLAAGYWDPAVRQPVSLGVGGPDGTRRFRTGDLARVRADGLLVHAGRKDAQVKVRGVRVEPAEVRAAIVALEGVVDAAVVPGVGADSEPCLCAAIVGVTGQSLDLSRLRSRLADRLPAAMVPERWGQVERLPRVGGGKIDAAAVRQATLNAAVSGEEASDEVEEIIVEIFREVLGVATIGRADDFFLQGGNSLRAVRVFGRLEQRTGVRLPIATIFRSPTPAMLAKQMEIAGASAGDPPFVRLVEGDGPSVLCFPGIGGNPLSFGELLKSIDLGRTFEGVQLPGAMGASKPIRSVEELADYFMEQVRIDNGQAPDMMAYSFGAGVMMEMASRWEASGVKPGKIVIVDGHLMCGLRPKRGLGRLLAHAGAVRYLGWRGGAEYVVRRVLGKDAKRATPRVFEQDESLAHIAELVAVNRKAMMAYRPTGSYSGEVLLIRASKPDWLRFMQDDGFNGWGDMIRGPIETVPVVASHQHVLKEPAMSVFALRVKAWLSRPMGDFAY